jgi:formylglycine-generating enzyme required for sulfatase activity
MQAPRKKMKPGSSRIDRAVRELAEAWYFAGTNPQHEGLPLEEWRSRTLLRVAARHGLTEAQIPDLATRAARQTWNEETDLYRRVQVPGLSLVLGVAVGAAAHWALGILVAAVAWVALERLRRWRRQVGLDRLGDDALAERQARRRKIVGRLWGGLVAAMLLVTLGYHGLRALGVLPAADESGEMPKAPPPSAEQLAEGQRLGVPVAIENEIGMRFVLIPGGTFTMGSPESERMRRDDEAQREVTLSPFYLSIVETTNAQYRAFQDDHEGSGPLQPAVEVSHDEAVAFAAWLAGRGTHRGARLPTEAEWEYACRAGTNTQFSTGETISTDQAHFYDDRKGGGVRGPIPVGTLTHNLWGLYDMHGNALEWCSDWYAAYSAGSQGNPQGPASGSLRVTRGGCFVNDRPKIRSAVRSSYAPGDRAGGIGFRVALPLPAR